MPPSPRPPTGAADRPRGVIRLLQRAAALVLACLTITGCGGVPERTAPAAATSERVSISVGAPVGAGCQSLLGGADLSGSPLSGALAAIPSAAAYAGILGGQQILGDKLEAARGLTVFVPVDEAFTALTPEIAAQLADPTRLQALVEYSVVPSILTPADFAAGDTPPVTTLRGPASALTLTSDGTTSFLNGTSSVLCGPVAISSGALYLTDTVLMPPA